MPHVVIVEDEAAIADTLEFALRADGFTTSRYSQAQLALSRLRTEPADFVILDVGLPDISGFEACKELRRFSSVPVLFLTARGSEVDRVVGLEIGADDYVTKPFSPLELLARIRAVLRRTDLLPQARGSVGFRSDDLSINFESQEVQKSGHTVALSATEYRLLTQLVRNAGHVVPRETLLARVWGDEYRDQTDYLKVYINRLRAKIEDDPERPRFILTERGLGYRFTRPSGSPGPAPQAPI